MNCIYYYQWIGYSFFFIYKNFLCYCCYRHLHHLFVVVAATATTTATATDDDDDDDDGYADADDYADDDNDLPSTAHSLLYSEIYFCCIN